MKNQIERFIFLIALLISILSLIFDSVIIRVLLLALSGAYLSLGWLLLNPYEGKKFNFVYFWLGYSFSSAFITLFFNQIEWPLVLEFHYSSIAMLVISIILIFSIRKIREKRFIENLFKVLAIMVLIVISLIN